MAAVLPFVLEGLISTDLPLRVSLAYLKWRELLSLRIFTANLLTRLKEAGKRLQKYMQELSQEINGHNISGKQIQLISSFSYVYGVIII